MTYEEQREAFERWIGEEGEYPERLRLDHKGDYASYSTYTQWQIWQAAHAARDAEVENLRDKLRISAEHLDDVLAEVEALKRDAERYQWIREKRSGEELTLVMNYEFRDLDEAIDAAMQENNTDKQE